MSATEAVNVEQTSAREAVNMDCMSAPEAVNVEQTSARELVNMDCMNAPEAVNVEQTSAREAVNMDCMSAPEAVNVEQTNAPISINTERFHASKVPETSRDTSSVGAVDDLNIINDASCVSNEVLKMQSEIRQLLSSINSYTYDVCVVTTLDSAIVDLKQLRHKFQGRRHLFGNLSNSDDDVLVNKW